MEVKGNDTYLPKRIDFFAGIEIVEKFKLSIYLELRE